MFVWECWFVLYIISITDKQSNTTLQTDELLILGYLNFVWKEQG